MPGKKGNDRQRAQLSVGADKTVVEDCDYTRTETTATSECLAKCETRRVRADEKVSSSFINDMMSMQRA